MSVSVSVSGYVPPCLCPCPRHCLCLWICLSVAVAVAVAVAVSSWTCSCAVSDLRSHVWAASTTYSALFCPPLHPLPISRRRERPVLPRTSPYFVLFFLGMLCPVPLPLLPIQNEHAHSHAPDGTHAPDRTHAHCHAPDRTPAPPHRASHLRHLHFVTLTPCAREPCLLVADYPCWPCWPCCPCWPCYTDRAVRAVPMPSTLDVAIP